MATHTTPADHERLSKARFLTAGILAGLALLTAACGSGGDSDNASSDSDGRARRIEVAMVDVDFEPKTLTVVKGEEVQFTFTNEGKIRHEAYFGTRGDQVDHGKEMAEGGEESGGHAGRRGPNNKITVEPGKGGDLTYRFDEPGTYEIGCHEPGHYAAGMKITVTVTVN
jgi:uncharacterized cupredoxin-like copper-binding protein